MKNNQKTAATVAAPEAPSTRYSDLKQMLDDRRREIQAEVQGKMRDVREEGTWGGKLNEVLDAVESAEADIQEDLEFALVQMKSETLNKINDALARLETGQLRQLLRLRRGDRREAPPGAALRRPLQGLRSRHARTPSSVSVSSSRGAARARCSSTCKLRRPTTDSGLRRWRSPSLPHRPPYH